MALLAIYGEKQDPDIKSVKTSQMALLAIYGEEQDPDIKSVKASQMALSASQIISLPFGQVIVSWPCHTDQLAVQGDIFCTPDLEGVHSQDRQVALSRIHNSRCSRKLSVCPNVAFVCFVCLALSIHAYREKVNIIIDFMMVPFSLGWHKALYLQVQSFNHKYNLSKKIKLSNYY